MKNNIFGRRGSRIISLVLGLFLAFSFDNGISANALSNELFENTVTHSELEEAFAAQRIGANSSTSSKSVCALADNIKVGLRIRELLFGKDSQAKELIVGGELFGAKIKQRFVSIVESHGIPALRPGDVILSINGKAVSSATEVKEAVNSSKGDTVTVRARHGKNEIAIEARPTFTDGEYRLGITLRDSAMGIGTLTFVDPETGMFGGLGHGICDAESGLVIEMESGEVSGVLLGGIHRGESGKPGELSGILTDENLGSLTSNCDCGVFGVLTDTSFIKGELVPIASRDDVSEGEAMIYSTLKNGKTAAYSVTITDIDRTSTGPKSFRIKVNDPTLKALTGGIIRGMSGSPIIQNGKLIGAVTHVLVANPTEGYGIFIENMLNAAQMPMAKAS